MVQSVSLGSLPDAVFIAWRRQCGMYEHIRNCYHFLRYWFIFTDGPQPYVLILSPTGRNCGRIQ